MSELTTNAAAWVCIEHEGMRKPPINVGLLYLSCAHGSTIWADTGPSSALAGVAQAEFLIRNRLLLIHRRDVHCACEPRLATPLEAVRIRWRLMQGGWIGRSRVVWPEHADGWPPEIMATLSDNARNAERLGEESSHG